MERFAIAFIKPAVPKFNLGNLSITPNALGKLSHSDQITALQRHLLGDWGVLDDEDKAANDAALKDGGRLLSVYYTADETKFWLITEADRSLTTILLPEDY